VPSACHEDRCSWLAAIIYARGSTDQAVADGQKSVTRQIEHTGSMPRARADGVPTHTSTSTTEFPGRSLRTVPGFLRLMDALKLRTGFQVLVTSEDSRLGREAIETAYALKRIIAAGVRVFLLLPRGPRERTLDSPTDKVPMSLNQYASEMERQQATAACLRHSAAQGQGRARHRRPRVRRRQRRSRR
jgi:hypothetical protein